jgi:hypothetical protein
MLWAGGRDDALEAWVRELFTAVRCFWCRAVIAFTAQMLLLWEGKTWTLRPEFVISLPLIAPVLSSTVHGFTAGRRVI